MTTLTTPRLIVRPFREADLPAFTAYRNDPAVARYQGWALPYPAEAAQDMLSGRALGEDGWVQRAVTLPAGTLLGDVALNTHGPQAELGVTLATHAQGRGYAREALTALIAHAFAVLGLHRLHAGIDPRNEPVTRLLTRLHFRHEGTHIQSYWHRGEWTDEATYALLRSEWTHDPTQDLH